MASQIHCLPDRGVHRVGCAREDADDRVTPGFGPGVYKRLISEASPLNRTNCGVPAIAKSCFGSTEFDCDSRRRLTH
jgi:hypothetical protein